MDTFLRIVVLRKIVIKDLFAAFSSSLKTVNLDLRYVKLDITMRDMYYDNILQIWRFKPFQTCAEKTHIRLFRTQTDWNAKRLVPRDAPILAVFLRILYKVHRMSQHLVWHGPNQCLSQRFFDVIVKLYQTYKGLAVFFMVEYKGILSWKYFINSLLPKYLTKINLIFDKFNIRL